MKNIVLLTAARAIVAVVLFVAGLVGLVLLVG